MRLYRLNRFSSRGAHSWCSQLVVLVETVEVEVDEVGGGRGRCEGVPMACCPRPPGSQLLRSSMPRASRISRAGEPNYKEIGIQLDKDSKTVGI